MRRPTGSGFNYHFYSVTAENWLGQAESLSYCKDTLAAPRTVCKHQDGTANMDAQDDSLVNSYPHNQPVFLKQGRCAKMVRYNWVSNHSRTQHLEQAVPHRPVGPGVEFANEPDRLLFYSWGHLSQGFPGSSESSN